MRGALRKNRRGAFYCALGNAVCWLQASMVYFGPLIYSSWRPLQHAGEITVEYHYLKAFADLDSAWSTASLVSSAGTEEREQTLRLIRAEVSTLVKCKKEPASPPSPTTHTPTLTPNLFNLSLTPSLFSLPSRRPPILRTVSLSPLSRKSAVSACLKVLRNFRESLAETLHLSTRSGTYPT